MFSPFVFLYLHVRLSRLSIDIRYHYTKLYTLCIFLFWGFSLKDHLPSVPSTDNVQTNVSFMATCRTLAIRTPGMSPERREAVPNNKCYAFHRLSRRRDMTEAVVKEDLLGLAAACAAGLEPFEISPLRVGLNRWIRANTRLFNEWYLEIREVYPFFLSAVLTPPAPHYHYRRRRRGTKRPVACSRPTTADIIEDEPTKQPGDEDVDSYPGLNGPIPEHFVLPDFPIPPGDVVRPRRPVSREAIFGAPVPLEPEVFGGPPLKHPWDTDSNSVINTGPSSKPVIPREMLPPLMVLPEPEPPRPSWLRLAPTMRGRMISRDKEVTDACQSEPSKKGSPPDTSRRRLVEADNRREWELLEKTAGGRMDTVEEDE